MIAFVCKELLNKRAQQTDLHLKEKPYSKKRLAGERDLWDTWLQVKRARGKRGVRARSLSMASASCYMPGPGTDVQDPALGVGAATRAPARRARTPFGPSSLAGRPSNLPRVVGADPPTRWGCLVEPGGGGFPNSSQDVEPVAHLPHGPREILNGIHKPEQHLLRHVDRHGVLCRRLHFAGRTWRPFRGPRPRLRGVILEHLDTRALVTARARFPLVPPASIR